MKFWKNYKRKRSIRKRIRTLKRQQERLAWAYFLCDKEEEKTSIIAVFGHNLKEIQTLKESL